MRPETSRCRPPMRRFDWPVMRTLPLVCAVSAIGLAAVPVPVKTIWKSRHSPLARMIVSPGRSEEHTSELQSLMRISYAVFCLKKKKQQHDTKDRQTVALQKRKEHKTH